MPVLSERYRGTYRDARGAETIHIVNDGTTLRTSIRGIELEGSDFDALDPVDADAAVAAGLTLAAGSLCACELLWDMPIAMEIEGEHEVATLDVHLVLGAEAPNGAIDREDLELRLTFSRGIIDSAGTSGWFEDELLDLQRQLPEGVSLHACITCGLSDYSPYGHGLFGGLLCFRSNKPAYRAVTNKQELFAILDSSERVQETYVCPELEPRTPGTGYRG